MFDNKSLYEMQVNLFVALLIDIFAVAIIKGEIIARRKKEKIVKSVFFSNRTSPKTISE